MSLSNISKTADAIKKIQVQGAENVAIAAVESLKFFINSSKINSQNELKIQLTKAKNILEKSRPTEPLMQNSLNFILKDLNLKPLKELKRELIEKIDFSLLHFKQSKEKIVEICSKKIKNGDVIFTHCHSSTVIESLIKAKQKGKKFEVHVTETRPLFQGRKTAEDLAKAGIKTTLFVDSAARIALKKADIMLLGCDAITTEKIYNKIGSELMINAAQEYNIPVYICSDSWKFDAKSIYGMETPIEQRDSKEIWDKKIRNLSILNPAFEMIEPSKTTATITELGVYKHAIFIEELKKKYYWMF